MSEKDNASLPLVSVIMRSMDRPTLTDALVSVAAQTYPHIEVVVVNAKGAAHSDLGELCGHFPLRLIQSGEPLSRSKAANVGLEAATGEYLIFLDDDDLFYPEHIANLIPALQNQQNIRCAYAGVHVEYYVGEKLKTTTDFNEPFDQRRLWGRNFIPIHAMLFAHSLVTAGCRFDENLDFFEDWDFWIQLTQHTSILHVNKIGAVYRNYGHSGLGLNQDKDNLRELRGKLYTKWKTTLTGEQLDDLIEYREETITRLNEQFIRSSHANAVREEALHQTINDLANSTSWKITAPLRFISKIIRGQHQEALAGVRRRLEPRLKAIYWRLPASLRNHVLTIIYRIAGPFFSGMAHYEAWRVNNRYSGHQIPTSSDGFLAKMVDIENFAPLKTKSPGRIAIHAHIFYPDLTTEFAKFLCNMPFAYDLFVSTPNEDASKICEQAFSKLPHIEQLTITIVPNRGRDIAPMFCTFGEKLQQYDYIAHIHSKKSLYSNGTADGWREYLLNNLLGSPLLIQRIFSLLTGDQNVGIIYPQNSSIVPYWANTWLSNKASGDHWCKKLGINLTPSGYFDFPMGSMFWARSAAIQPLFNAHLKIEHFPKETGQNDATLAHCIERLFVLTTRHSGFKASILQDKQSLSWSRWRIDQYLRHQQEEIQATLQHPDVRIVVFDIFDTLLTRPLLNPESIKQIVAQRAGGKAGENYLEFRATAENQARQIAGRDIDLDAIFKELAVLSGLPTDDIMHLQKLEETIETSIVSPRPETIALFQLAVNLGKRVILASDMYLSKQVIENMLLDNKISGWHAFYLSSSNGLRKDTSDFYRQLLIDESVSPHEVMIIGDNEHSDVQNPVDMKFKTTHVMRPVELARATPRFGPIIEQAFNRNMQHDLNAQLLLGTIAQANFHPIFYPQFNLGDFVPTSPWATGFTVAGPLVLSFIQWLTKKAQTDGIQRLYFLAREGQILKMVYDMWASNDTHAVASEYLVLSRRAITVPMISNQEDIFKIARTHYAPNPMPDFIFERFGITLSDQECEELARQKIWLKNRAVSVAEENIDHLKPLLQALEARILDRAKQERPGLMAYLHHLGFNSETNAAIVDVGYAATTQDRLNRLLEKKTHGYYLMTLEHAKQVAASHQVTTEGYYCHYAKPTATEPVIYRKSFTIEKFLSADSAQIVCYKKTGSGDIIPEFRRQSDEEHQTIATRAEIRRGIMDFVTQSIAIRDHVLTDFEIPKEIAETLFLQFIKNPSQSETDLLHRLVLDDYYYGHGLVR